MDFKLVETALVVVIFSLCVGPVTAVSIDARQVFELDESSGMRLGVDYDSEVDSDSLEEEFNSSLILEDDVYRNGDSSFLYYFEDVYPHSSEQDFLTGIKVGNQSLDRINMSFERDRGLLNTVFTLRLESPGFNSSEKDQETVVPFVEQDQTPSVDSFDYEVQVFGEITDTNGERLDRNSVEFSLTEDRDYFVKFRASSLRLFLSNLDSSGPGKPDWNVSEWSNCTRNETQTRQVHVLEGKSDFVFRPQDSRECSYSVRESPEELVLSEDEIDEFPTTSRWEDASRQSEYIEEASLLNESSVEGEDVEEGFRRGFSMGNATFEHKVVRPEGSSGEYMKMLEDEYLSRDYEYSIGYVNEADESHILSKKIGSTTVLEDIRDTDMYYEQQIDVIERVILASKYDVVHIFREKGPSYEGNAVNDVSSDLNYSRIVMQTE